jgi:triosephosphate isomerase
MLKDAGCTHVIVGHSERRHGMGETNERVGQKLKAALSHGLTPILCVGETSAERQAKRTATIVVDQMEAALRGIAEAEAASLLIAYEPVWAIGTGVNATAEQATEVHRLLRDWLVNRYSPAFADRTRILYGGSVKPDNAAELLAAPEVDGALVGGASLSAASFLSIIDACAKRASARGSKP